MESNYKNCQSCGMPLKSDDKRGTDAGGSKSNMYCSNCYVDGKFTLPDHNVSQMQEHVKGIMKGMGFPGFLAGMFTKNIPKLVRWKRG